MVRYLLQEPGLGRGELDLECGLVQRLDGDLVPEPRTVLRARVVVLRADDSVELVRVVGAELGRNRPLPRELEVLRGHRVAVCPFAVPTKVEGDGLAVRADVPTLGKARRRIQVFIEL